MPGTQSGHVSNSSEKTRLVVLASGHAEAHAECGTTRLQEQQLAATRFLVGDRITLADVSLLAYTRLAHEGGFHLDGYAAVRRWIGEAEQSLGLPPVR